MTSHPTSADKRWHSAAVATRSYHTTAMRFPKQQILKLHILYRTNYKLCSHLFNMINGFGINSHASEMFQCSSGNVSWNAGHSCGSSRPHLCCTWLSHRSTSANMHCTSTHQPDQLTHVMTLITVFRIMKIIMQ